jgi:hypothetical protein
MGIAIGSGITIEGGISITREFEIPENIVAPVVSGTAIARGTVTSTTGTWSTIQAPTYAYQWQHNSANISGATANTYVIDVGYVGENLQCVVKATNSYGNSFATSNSIGPVTANVPLAPTIGTATKTGANSAIITFTAPSSNGGSAITSYTVSSNTGGLTVTGAASPLTVTGLVTSNAYTFTVTATNSIGTSSPSSASNSVRISPNVGEYFGGGYFLSDNGATYTVVGPLANEVTGNGVVVLNSYFSANINGYTGWDSGTVDNWEDAYTNKAVFANISQGFANTEYWTGEQVFPLSTDKMYYIDMNTGTVAQAFKYSQSPYNGPIYRGRPFRTAAWEA